jgi:hypothetical protein
MKNLDTEPRERLEGRRFTYEYIEGNVKEKDHIAGD